jgi:hypothetical protein
MRVIGSEYTQLLIHNVSHYTILQRSMRPREPDHVLEPLPPRRLNLPIDLSTLRGYIRKLQQNVSPSRHTIYSVLWSRGVIYEAHTTLSFPPVTRPLRRRCVDVGLFT